ncbi:serine hydrolase domain-containing protein [Pseudohongiella spirulinae]|uniref:Beta-lactamase n=1 Tax=Pseudohongiella spirulinae TaxID=1249552 RepID=A0A0S2K9V9_9GAMM|nr:serine hydrolase [Pseudohongiella spirulinae]ALO45082.1 Beta-lactamase [Pseudohongiella spirulinae]
MKKILITAVVVVVIALASSNGITPAYLAAAPGVASGIGAKLLCSARYVSGFSEQQSLDDLVQYSPLLEYLNIEFDDNLRQVHASLFGMAPRTASYVEGIGCYSDFDGYPERASYQQTLPMPVFTSHWPHGSRVDTINHALQSQLDQMISSDNSQGLNTRALLIVKDGRIVAESYAQNVNPETPVLGWSMAKSLMAVMLGNLEYRGILDTGMQPVFREWSHDERSTITLQNLLTMTDGLDFSEQYNPGDDATAMLFTEPSSSDYAIRRPLRYEPGARFNYSSGTANLLSRVYFDHTGATLSDSLQDYRQHIATPMSFQHSVFETDAAGILVGSSYFYASARDWARLGQMMLNGGVLNGARIVNEEWVRRATTPNNSDNNRAYGYQWWLNRGNRSLRWPDLPADAYAAQGNREQSITVMPSRNMVVVRLGWTSGRYPINDRVAEMLSWFTEEPRGL